MSFWHLSLAVWFLVFDGWRNAGGIVKVTGGFYCSFPMTNRFVVHRAGFDSRYSEF